MPRSLLWKAVLIVGSIAAGLMMSRYLAELGEPQSRWLWDLLLRHPL